MGDPQKARHHDDGSIEEPEHSTVDDWFGQNVARDAELADRLVDEEDGDREAAEARFERESTGRERYAEGHRRP